MLDFIIEVGRHKGRTVRTALEYQESKLREILSSVNDIGGSAPHLERELGEVIITKRVLEEIFAHDYSI